MRLLNRKLGGLVRASALAVLSIGLVAPAWGARFAYVANFCSLCQSSVSSFSIDPVSGALSGATQTAAGQSASSITIEPSGKFAYLAVSSGIEFFSVNQSTGVPTMIGSVTHPASTANLAAVAIEPGGRFAYGAYLSTSTSGYQGGLHVYSLNPANGGLSWAAASVATGSYPNSIAIDPRGRYLYVANRGSSTIGAYAINATTGALTAISSPAAAVSHLFNTNAIAIDPAGRFLYVAGETGANNLASISLLRIDPATGALSAGPVTYADTGARPESLDISPDGRFLYTANYGTNTVTVYAIDPASGVLSRRSAATAGNWPHAVRVDPGGKVLYVANYLGNSISTFAIDSNTGGLTPVGSTLATGSTPSAIALSPITKPYPGHVALTASDSPLKAGRNGLFTATVMGYQPTGTVRFKVDGVTASGCDAVPLATGVAQCSTPFTTVGTRAISAEYSGDADRTAGSAQLTLAVVPPAITVQSPPAGTYGAAYSTTLSAAGGSAPYAFSSGDPLPPGLALNSTGALAGTPTAAGNYSFSVTGTDMYGFIGTNTVSLNIAGMPQTIVFDPVPALTIGGMATLSATGGGSGNPVTFTATTPTTCTVTGSTLTAVAAGTCTVIANQASSINHAAATAVSRNLTIAKLSQSIAFSTTPGLVVGGSAAVNAKASSDLATTLASTTPGLCSVSGSTVTAIASGTCTVAANQAGDTRYDAAPQARLDITIKIGQTIGAITLNPSTLPMNAVATATATASSGLAVSLASATPAVCTVTGNSVRAVAAGTCTLVASQAGNASHAAAMDSTQSFTVIRGTQSISFDTVLGTSPQGPLLKATSSSGLPVTFSSISPSICSVSGSVLSALAPGSCIIAADQAGNADYFSAAQVTRTFSMAAPTLSLSPAGLNFETRKVGAVGTPQRIAVTNPGTTPVTIGQIAASGDFAIDSDCGSQLTGGASCAVDVVFAPLYPGAHGGSVSVSSNASGSPHTIALSGTGTLDILAYPLSLEVGWNLLGNSINKVLNVGRLFGDPSIVTTVWKWNTATSGWDFYTPQMTATALETYAAGKGYGVLAEIRPGEGYWVNAKAKTSLVSPSAAPYERMTGNLVSGWNLVGTGIDVSPADLNASLGTVDPPVTITTLWAWNSSLSQWYFYAPSLDAQGAGVLAGYVAGKGYLDFAATQKTLGKGTGFWINATSQRLYPPYVTTGVAATGWPCGTDDATQPKRAVVCDYCGTAAPNCTEPNADGKYTLIQAAADTLACVYKQGVRNTWFDRRVTNLGTSIGNVVKAACRVGDRIVRLNSVATVDTEAKKTQNVNKVTDTVAKVVDTEAKKEEAAAGEIEVSEFPPPTRKVDQTKLDAVCQGLKSMWGPLGSLLGSDCTAKDPNYKADSVYPTDHAQDLIDIEVDGAGNIVTRDKSGKVVANAPTTKIATNTVSGDAETVTQSEHDAAQTIATTIANCQPPNTVQNGVCVAPPVNCVVSDWSLWGTCTASCGGGTQTRTRTILTQPANSGLACPVLTEQQSCNTQACVIGVTGTWNFTRVTKFTNSRCTQYNGSSEESLDLTEDTYGNFRRTNNSTGVRTGVRNFHTLNVTWTAPKWIRSEVWTWDGANSMTGHLTSMCVNPSTGAIDEEILTGFSATRQ